VTDAAGVEHISSPCLPGSLLAGRPHDRHTKQPAVLHPSSQLTCVCVWLQLLLCTLHQHPQTTLRPRCYSCVQLCVLLNHPQVQAQSGLMTPCGAMSGTCTWLRSASTWRRRWVCIGGGPCARRQGEGGGGGGGKKTAMTWGCSCCYAVCVVVHQ
jgi:hypothetical protein